MKTEIRSIEELNRLIEERRQQHINSADCQTNNDEYWHIAGEAAYDYGMARQAIETIDD